MSQSVLSTGFMALLVTPIGNHRTEDWRELSERLFDEDTGLDVNYEGTMMFSDHRGDEDDIYGLRIEGVMDPSGAQFSNADTFAAECEKQGYPVIKESIRRYSCYWYTGSDSYMSDLKAEDYKSQVGLA